MQTAPLSSVEFRRIGDQPPCVGRIAAIDAHGRPLVTVPGTMDTPTIARCLVRMSYDSAADLSALPPVAVAFEDGDPAFPLIMGWIYDRILDESLQAVTIPSRNSVREALVDGERIVFRGEREVVLECGQSSITLTSEGRIVIKGTHLVSRSSGPHKIKGSTVDIN